MTQYRSARPTSRRVRRRSSLRFLMTVLLTTGMITTGGFGTFPDNPITQAFQEAIGQNFPEEFLNPINLYLESLSAPTIQPQFVSESESVSSLDLVGLLLESIPTSAGNLPTELAEEQIPALALGQTQSVLATVTDQPMLTVTTAPTNTNIPTASATILASPTTLPPIILFPTSTRSPIPADTSTSAPSATSIPTSTLTPSATLTLTSTLTNTATLTPSATLTPTTTFTVTATATAAPLFSIGPGSVNINGSGTSPVTVLAGQTFFVAYNYSIWDDPCPSCATQLVTGLGTAGSHSGTCAFNGVAGPFPGTASSENVNLTAPVTSGTYNVVVVSNWQFTCADALNAYPGGSTPQVIGQIIVP